MKLYYHPVSTTSRPIMMLAADENIDLEYEVVDLMTGAHFLDPFTSINPCQQVPVLEDDDFRLTESSAILKYLADKVGSSCYPTDLRERARVNERMDWFNTGLYRELGYGVIYPQVLPNYRREDAAAQAAHLDWGCRNARRWLSILDQHILGANPYVCGNRITLADYLGVGMLTLGEVTRFEYGQWRNVARWIDTMKARAHWNEVNEVFYAHFVAPYKAAEFVSV